VTYDQRSDAQAFRDFEEEGWNRSASRYADAFGLVTVKFIDPLLDVAQVGEGTRLLDIACGPGSLAARAASRGAKPVGVDISEGMLDEARRLNPTVEFHQAPAESLPLEDRAFDAVCINFGMHHFAEPDRAAAEAFRVMAPGGRLAYTVWSPRSTFLDIATAAVEGNGSLDVALPKGPPVMALAEHAASDRLLGDAGFVEIEIEEPTRDMVLESADHALDVLDSVTRTRALVEAQTPEAQALIRHALVEGAREFERDGKVRLPMTSVLVSATRPAS